NRGTKLGDAASRLVELGRKGCGTLLQFGPRFLESLYLRRERAGALDERGMRGARFGGAQAQSLSGFTGFEQTALRRGQPLVGRALRFIEPRDRGARFLLTTVEDVALLLRLPAFARELLGLLRQPRGFVGGVLQLRFVADH